MGPLTRRINRTPQTAIDGIETMLKADRDAKAREPFVAPWRRRSIEQAGGKYRAVNDLTERAA